MLSPSAVMCKTLWEVFTNATRHQVQKESPNKSFARRSLSGYLNIPFSQWWSFGIWFIDAMTHESQFRHTVLVLFCHLTLCSFPRS